MATTTWTKRTGRIDALEGIAGSRGDYDGVIELVGDRRIVLLGEASHGTHEFYRERDPDGIAVEFFCPKPSP